VAAITDVTRSIAGRARGQGLWLLTRLHRRLKSSPAGGVLRSRPVRAVRRRFIVGMRARDVFDVLDILERAGIPCWLVGGWGVDALVGRQTRDHPDVDLALERRFVQQALAAFERAGFAVVQEEIAMPMWMPTMIVLRDAARRTVELMPVDLPEPAPGQDGRPEAMRFRYGPDAITQGSIDGRRVPCLSATVQLTFHGGYAPRDSDRHDVGVLVDRFSLPPPPEYS
jgi:lincosamide nucleotidyltransferase A/C/D/E